ncbi:hypothetical protein SLEP1_g27877 [Rubroshorea leprosula]|uniref:Uncharacterized protein n=1 Tax=Rubroshorea leprosula TaxID=152421 RepID=A0AAV5JRS9_9ROSI|nr:hypothetical protein SLEP1_g27877 [Rubroshorea leprosula]
MDPQWADLLLSPIINTTVSKLISTAAEQISLAVGWKKELASLQNKLIMVQAVLKDAEERQISSPAVKLWLEKLRDVVYEADDVLDEVSYESVKCKVETKDQKMKKVRNLLTSNPLLFHRKIAGKIKNIIATVDAINNEARGFGLQIRFATASGVVSEHRRNPQTHSTIGDLSEVVGREDDVSKIVQLLIDSSDESRLCVLSIVGMPGLGKTTLAQAVRNDEQIKNYFGKIMWVCVLDDFYVERILTEMLESLTGNAGGAVKNKDTLIQKIREAMEENNFLLILDGVWDEESHGKFEDLRSCLLGICKNSRNRVIVTTRDEKVALKMRMHHEHMHRLGKLSDADCWSIISKRVFGDASASIPSELEKIGLDIAQLCGGLPLVASVIGGTLCTEKLDRIEWSSFKSKIEALGPLELDNGIMRVIELSFDRLSKPALKQCFAFCSVFPKDFFMEREMLIQLWMAKGFLQSPEESPLTMEDIGNKYINDLLSFSLFQEERRDALESVNIGCKMHDLIHDFAQLISKSETVIWKTLSRSNISNVRNLNLIFSGVTLPTTLRDVAPKLHSLFLKDGVSSGIQGDLKSLRVLSFVDAVNTEELPPCFDNIKSLKYLDISRTRITDLPKFITKLYNLQTFKFMTCRSLKMPPEGIGSLINLRHIYFSDEEQMPANIGRLTSLQTLPMFFVGATKGCKIEELGSLRGLKGSLKICNLEHVEDRLEAMRAKLHEKTIFELRLGWEKDSSQDEDVLEGLQPHSNLQVLEISGYGGKNLPSWMLKNVMKYDLFLLKNLVELRIIRCKKLESIPVMTGFSSLRMLLISKCYELRTISDGAFAASVKELVINRCHKLESVALNGLSLLQKLKIHYCLQLNSIGDSLSTSTCLKDLSLWHCNNLKFIPSLFGLTSLQLLRFDSCGLEHLPTGLSSCNALTELEICYCRSLISIPEELKEIPSLVGLQIESCSNLRNFPENTLNSLTSLKRLGIGDFSKELEEFPVLSSIHSPQASLEELKLIGWGELTELPHLIQNLNLSALKSLSISYFNEVETLPKWLGNLSSLKSLSILGCLRLKYLPTRLSFFTTLEELVVRRCHNLVSTKLEETLGCLARLKRLWIGHFSEELDEFPSLSLIHHLSTSLEKLELYGWEKLTQLPHQIQHLITLRELYIHDFHGVEALPEWLGNLSSLQDLHIDHCKNLKHLPSVEAIRCLSKLKYLDIWVCPELQKRCGKESGSEWYKISHIPTIRIKTGDYI